MTQAEEVIQRSIDQYETDREFAEGLGTTTALTMVQYIVRDLEYHGFLEGDDR